ncbi:MAG: hypothetical protein ACRDL5_06145 [Solirubrobacteraceae bacterium]
MNARLVVRVLALAFSLVAIAWFALGARQAIDVDRAQTIVSSATLTAGQARRADSLLSAAGFLNPDTEVPLLRSQVALARGNKRRARQLAAAVTGQEPLNSQAWVQLAKASTTAAQFRSAFEHLGKLVPPLGGHHRG